MSEFEKELQQNGFKFESKVGSKVVGVSEKMGEDVEQEKVPLIDEVDG